MGSLNREQFNILIVLREETLALKTYMRPSAICKSFSPPLEMETVSKALDGLIDQQFAETDGRNRYRVTHLGAELARITIEGQLGKNPKFDSNMMLTRSPWKFDEVADQPKRMGIDWTKWGAVAGILAIPVTILLAWWFSK